MSTLSTELRDLFNEQINLELSASYSYLAMAAWFENTPYAGFASWMHMQSAEERDHAMKFFQFLVDRGDSVELKAISTPAIDYSSPLEIFQTSLVQEREVTASIHRLYDCALEQRDHESKNLLNWFLDEQIEEEKNAQDIIERLELVGNDPVGLLQIDSEAGTRATSTSSGDAEV